MDSFKLKMHLNVSRASTSGSFFTIAPSPLVMVCHSPPLSAFSASDTWHLVRLIPRSRFQKCACVKLYIINIFFCSNVAPFYADVSESCLTVLFIVQIAC